MPEFKYQVVETYGSLSESNKGWKKEIKLISWNQKEAKYDIREWSPDGENGKGSHFEQRRDCQIERFAQSNQFRLT